MKNAVAEKFIQNEMDEKTKQFFSQIVLSQKDIQKQNNVRLNAILFSTPLGPMVAVADEHKLYLLEFLDCDDVKREVKQLRIKTKADIIFGYTQALYSIENELSAYFKGTLREFKTPYYLIGTDFQQTIWESLTTIPYGQTRSYLEVAEKIKKPTAFRAAAQANGANQLAIIVPCHRVINASGALGGYAGGVARKQALLDLESQNR